MKKSYLVVAWAPFTAVVALLIFHSALRKQLIMVVELVVRTHDRISFVEKVSVAYITSSNVMFDSGETPVPGELLLAMAVLLLVLPLFAASVTIYSKRLKGVG